MTGMSGTGKSSALAGLAGRGFRVVDTDEPGWSEWAGEGDRRWLPAPMDGLLAEEGAGTLFVSGCVSNQGEFYDRFDEVALLSAPADVLLDRLEARTTNDYGKEPGERARILEELESIEPLLRATCTREIDARKPLDDVITELAALAVSPCWPPAAEP